MKYSEQKECTQMYKTQYVRGVEKLIAGKEAVCAEERQRYFQNILDNQEIYREELKKFLGWPLVGHEQSGIISINRQKLYDEKGYSIYRMQFEVLDGVILTGLLFQKGWERRPLVIAQHGKLGTPEAMAGFYGNTTNYNHMIDRILKYDVNVLAPQLLLWDEKSYQISYDRQLLDARLKRVGSSIAAVELWGIRKIIDYFETQRFVSNFGMIGLSYGGFYTLFSAALDTRIKAAISCSYFNTREKYLFSDWAWSGVAYNFGDAEVAGLVCPRMLYVQVGTDDTVFGAKDAVTEAERLKGIWKNHTEWLHFMTFPGAHEFCKEDVPIEKLVEKISNE